MRNTLFFIAFLAGLMSFVGCVTDAKKETPTVDATGNAAGDDAAKKAWREKVKARQANKDAGAKAGNRPNAGRKNNPVNGKLKEKYKQPVVTDKNKGVFIAEAQQYMKLTPAKTSELETLIKKYKRKGLDFKFFGGFYSNKKPFARDLSKVLSPVQVEKFKHFHAYWFDRIPYPRPEMPVALYYHLKLDKDQFIKVLDIYSETTVAKADGNARAVANGIAQIEGLLNGPQKRIYQEIQSISTDKF